jgi:hypothetical protein
MTLEIVRVGQSPRGTFGILRYGHVPFAVTLEPPWQNNATDISCIPAGRYRCRRVRSTRFGETFEIMEVPNRSYVLFHRGNQVHDTKGCVCVAEEFGGTFSDPMIVSSERGYREFMQLTRGLSEFWVVISESLPSAEERWI